MQEKFYGDDQKEKIHKMIDDPMNSIRGMNEVTALIILDTLGEIGNALQGIVRTLQRIEITLQEPKSQ